MAKKYTPDDLANFVFKQLTKAKISVRPSEKVLTELFNTLYYTSLKTEEGQFIKVTATLVDQTRLKDFDEDNDQLDRWQFYAFERPLEFNIKNMVKLSKAADPWSSSLAIYFDDQEELFIYGMIDQAIHYQSFLNYEREDKPLHPAIIQTTINGIGILNVMLDYQALATLHQDTLIRQYPNIFKVGPIAEFLKEHSSIPKKKLEELIGGELESEEAEAYQEVAYEYYVQALCRLLIKIRNYHHGGAILIARNRSEGLEKKYAIQYNRISQAIEHLVASVAEDEFIEGQINRRKRRKLDIPLADFKSYEANQLDLEDAYNEMNGAIRFAASLSCVDGLVVLSPRLNVYGFGTVITEDKAGIKEVYISTTSKPSSTVTLQRSNHFGTRHQSMFAYCRKHPGSVGFVISQDGEIRAVKSIDGKVYVWENIRVYNFLRSNKIPVVTFSLKPV